MGHLQKFDGICMMWRVIVSSCLLVNTLSLLSLAQEQVSYETVTFGGYNFSVSDSQLPWSQAVTACKARGQKLASVESAEKDDILVTLFSEYKHTNVTLKGNSWISATETRTREGVWYWDSLEKPTYYTRWFMDGQPDDKENLNCVYLASTALLYWRDANCSASMYFICESQIDSTTTTVAPTLAPSSSPITRASITIYIAGSIFLLSYVDDLHYYRFH